MSKDTPDKLGPPPVDPLSTAAWSRIERGVFERLDAGESREPVAPPRAKWPWLVVPALAAAAAIAAVLVTRTPTTHVVANGSSTIPQVTDEPSRVVAGDAASAVSFGDAHLTLAPHAAVVMAHEGDAPSVMLDRGATTFEVAPRNGRPAFVVRAADVVVRVVGTRFTVARSDERVEVSVDHGIVDVQYRAQVTRLTAGQHWASDDTSMAVTPATVVTPSAPETTNTPATNTTNAPTTNTPTTNTPTTSLTPAKLTDRERFDRSAALEASNPKAAIDGYLELAKGSSSWSPVALFAAGRLAADKKDPRARALLGTYLKRFPGGANAADARDLLDHLGASR